MQFIVDELFVGNKLAAGEIRTSRRQRGRPAQHPLADRGVLLRRATTSPRRSRRSDWILDLYDNVDDIRAHGQTIVYTVHQKIGHLGIFVSGGIARKEHGEFSSNIDLIDVLPPGLYEATFERKMRRYGEPGSGRRAIGSCAASRARSTTSARWAATIRPTIVASQPRPGSPKSISRSIAPSRSRSCARLPTPMMAEWMQKLHPLRLQYELFSDRTR